MSDINTSKLIYTDRPRVVNTVGLSTVTLANQISIEVVSKMLHHSSINMTKKYARVVDDLIHRDMYKIYGKYGTVVVN